MANRQIFWTKNETEQNTTQNTYQDAATLTFTPDASSNYMIYVCFNLGNNSSSYLSYAELYDTTGSAQVQECIIYQPNTNNRVSQHFMMVFTSGASPTAQTYKLRIKTDSGGTVYVDSINFFALKLTSYDVFASSTGETTTTTSGTLYSKVTVASGRAGYFCTVTHATLYTTTDNSATPLLDSLILINTTGSSPLDRVNPYKAAARISIGGHRVDNLAASYNLGILYRLYAGTQLAIKNAWVVGLYMNNFDDWGGIETDPATTTTSTSISNDLAYALGNAGIGKPLLICSSCSCTLSNTTYRGHCVNRRNDGTTDVYTGESAIAVNNTGEYRFSHTITIMEQGSGHWTDLTCAHYVDNSGVTLTRRYEKLMFFQLTEPLCSINAVQDGTHIDIGWETEAGEV